MSKRVFMVDVSKCNGCFNCQLACKDEHCDNDWRPYAAPQPEIGQFWLKLNENIAGSAPKVRIHYIPRLCNHCDNPACMSACGFDAIYKREDGLVIIDPEKCKNCGHCRSACPYDVIFENDEEKLHQKCTGCAHLLDNGRLSPRCVEACPTEAIILAAPDEDFIIGATVFTPEAGTMPNVYYRNIPGKFIAGTVYDPIEKEVIIGAKVRATNGNKTTEVLTDEYGDFWFKDLAPGKYDVVIEAKDYEYKAFPAVNARESVNLGDIPLEVL